MEYVYPAVKKYLHLWKVQQDSLVGRLGHECRFEDAESDLVFRYSRIFF